MVISTLTPARGESTSFVVSRLEGGVIQTELMSEEKLLSLFRAGDSLTGDAEDALSYTVNLTQGEGAPADAARPHLNGGFALLVHSVDGGDASRIAAMRAERYTQSHLTAHKERQAAAASEVDAGVTLQNEELMGLFARAEKAVKQIQSDSEPPSSTDEQTPHASFIKAQRDRSYEMRSTIERRLDTAGMPLPELPPGIERGFGVQRASTALLHSSPRVSNVRRTLAI
jgi:hypothetical protein